MRGGRIMGGKLNEELSGKRKIKLSEMMRVGKEGEMEKGVSWQKCG